MTSLTFAAVLHLSLISAGGQTYAAAHRLHVETGRPLVVLVGADWCPACQTMKNSIIPQAQRQGVLDKVEFVQINSDEQPELSRKLMSGGAIPQLIVYHKTAEGWQRRELVGAQSISAIQQAVAQPAAPPAVAAPAKATPGIGR